MWCYLRKHIALHSNHKKQMFAMIEDRDEHVISLICEQDHKVISGNDDSYTQNSVYCPQQAMKFILKCGKIPDVRNMLF